MDGEMKAVKTDEYEFNGLTGICHICSVALSSKAMAQQHLNGSKHLKKKASLSAPSPNPSNVIGGVRNQGVFQPPPLFGHTATPAPDASLLGGGSHMYRWNGTSGQCLLCNVQFTSQELANDHLKGKKHKKKLDSVKQERSIQNYNQSLLQGETGGKFGSHVFNQKDYIMYAEDRGYCNVCSIELTSKAHAGQHLSGAKHIKKASTWNGMHEVPLQQIETKPKQLDAFPCTPVKSVDHPVSNFNAGISNFTFDKATGVGRCDVCQVDFTSQQMADQHLKGKQHMKLSQQPISTTTTNPSSLYCTICKISVSGPENMKQHLEGSSHKRRAGTSSGATLTSNEETCLSSDDKLLSFTGVPVNQKSYPCHVCGCWFKSQKELEMHYNSDQHRNSLVKLGSIGMTKKLYEENLIHAMKDLSLSDTSSLFSPNGPEAMSYKDNSYINLLQCNSSEETLLKDVHVTNPISTQTQDSEISSGASLVKQAKEERNNEKKNTVIAVSDDLLTGDGESLFSVSYNINDAGGPHSNEVNTNPFSTSKQGISTFGENLLGSYVEKQELTADFDSESRLCKGQNILSSLTSGILAQRSSNTDICTPMPTSCSPLPFLTPRRTPDDINKEKFRCSLCNVGCNTAKALADHERGKQHQAKLTTSAVALERDHPPLVKFSQNEYQLGSFKLTETQPRSYQVELLNKIMKQDPKETICFLPTGTGKTLVACLAISAMLDLNPTRQILFVVNKVLLVLQQSKYLEKEIGERKYGRFKTDNPSEIITRTIKIAALCGGQQGTKGIPLWQHDIIVVTAEYLRNLIDNKLLRWEDQSLLVFDEAHHCQKSHPYNVLLQGLHDFLPEKKCKILGLTASPAGKKDYLPTVEMLQQLQDNLTSNVAIVRVENQELQKFQSNSKISCVATSSDSELEKAFDKEIRRYLFTCYEKLASESDVTDESSLGINSPDDLNDDMVIFIQNNVAQAKPKNSNSAIKLLLCNLENHIQHLCMCINVMVDMGYGFAIEELQELFAADTNSGFEFAKSIGLPCETLTNTVMECIKSSSNENNRGEANVSPSVWTLIEQIVYRGRINWHDKNQVVLVLVRQRATAIQLSETLSSQQKIRELGLTVTYLIGHGTGGGMGMSVPQQKRTLEDIKARQYNIVIATSVAEEGIDLPDCELVICMNPPSTLTALVQMRGRARKKNSNFVIICKDPQEEEKIQDLLRREEYMVRATNELAF